MATVVDDGDGRRQWSKGLGTGAIRIADSRRMIGCKNLFANTHCGIACVVRSCYAYYGHSVVFTCASQQIPFAAWCDGAHKYYSHCGHSAVRTCGVRIA
jgi:hypothetical protein